MPSLACIGGGIDQGERCECIPACSDKGCTAPIPKASRLVATEDALDTLCPGGWAGRRPDCIALSPAGRDVEVVIVELKHAGKLGSQAASHLAGVIADKVEDSLNNLKNCVGLGAGPARLKLRVHVAMPFGKIQQVAMRLRNMIAKTLQRISSTHALAVRPCLVLYECDGSLYFSTC